MMPNIYIFTNVNRFQLNLILCFILLISNNLHVNAESYLSVPVQFIVENGNFHESYINVKSDDTRAYLIKGQKNLRLKLKYGHDYLLSFAKPGYITKTIRINTVVTADRAKYGFEPYKIGVRLFKQYEGVNIVVFNQPVAYIHYHEDLDSYAYDVDYTKSILSELSQAEKQLSQKATEERAMIKVATTKLDMKMPDVNPISLNAKENIMSKNFSDGITNEDNFSNTVDKTTIEVISDTDLHNETATVGAKNIVMAGDHIPKISSAGLGTDAPLINSTSFGQDNLDIKLNRYNGNELPNISNFSDNGLDNKPVKQTQSKFYNKTLDQIFEKGKVITYVKIFDGDQLFSYKKVKYDWGGVFYFKDSSTPISEHTFNELSK